MFGTGDSISHLDINGRTVHAHRKSIHDLPKTQRITILGNVRVQRFLLASICTDSYRISITSLALLSCYDTIGYDSDSMEHAHFDTQRFHPFFLRKPCQVLSKHFKHRIPFICFYRCILFDSLYLLRAI